MHSLHLLEHRHTSVGRYSLTRVGWSVPSVSVHIMTPSLYFNANTALPVTIGSLPVNCTPLFSTSFSSSARRSNELPFLRYIALLSLFLTKKKKDNRPGQNRLFPRVSPFLLLEQNPVGMSSSSTEDYYDYLFKSEDSCSC